MSKPRLYPNECVAELVAGIPRGHRHLRLVLRFRDGSVIVLHEATVAAIVRAYVTILTHPRRTGVRMIGVKLGERKRGYAEWQLLEAEVDDRAVSILEEYLSQSTIPEACLSGEEERRDGEQGQRA